MFPHVSTPSCRPNWAELGKQTFVGALCPPFKLRTVPQPFSYGLGVTFPKKAKHRKCFVKRNEGYEGHAGKSPPGDHGCTGMVSDACQCVFSIGRKFPRNARGDFRDLGLVRNAVFQHFFMPHECTPTTEVVINHFKCKDWYYVFISSHYYSQGVSTTYTITSTPCLT